MRVRAGYAPDGRDMTRWVVEVRKFFSWKTVNSFSGETAKEDAIAFAKKLKNAEVVEV